MSTLLADVHGCHECDATVYGFERAPDREGYLKFPATIGAVGPATLLFVGINPYRTVRNELLYEEAMASLDAFGTLAGNREPHPGSTSTPYIRRHIPGERRRYGREPFYDQYMEVIKGVWEEDTAFEEHAVATELYLCSTVGIGNRAFVSASLCAARFFARTFAQVLPKAVITVGARRRV